MDLKDIGFYVFVGIAILIILYYFFGYIFGYDTSDVSLLGLILSSGRGIVIWVAAFLAIISGIVIGFQYFPVLTTIVVAFIILYKIIL